MKFFPKFIQMDINKIIFCIIYGIIRSFPLIFNNATMLYNATFTLSDYSKYSLGDESTLSLFAAASPGLGRLHNKKKGIEAYIYIHKNCK